MKSDLLKLILKILLANKIPSVPNKHHNTIIKMARYNFKKENIILIIAKIKALNQDKP